MSAIHEFIGSILVSFLTRKRFNLPGALITKNHYKYERIASWRQRDSISWTRQSMITRV